MFRIIKPGNSWLSWPKMRPRYTKQSETLPFNLKADTCVNNMKSLCLSQKMAQIGREKINLRYDLTDTVGVLENKVLSMFYGLDD